jgi:hypothetical protein
VSEDEAEERAARTVNKLRSEHGETKGQQATASWSDDGGGWPRTGFAEAGEALVSCRHA